MGKYINMDLVYWTYIIKMFDIVISQIALSRIIVD